MSIVNMLSPIDGDGDRAMVPMCERHQEEAEREGWIQLNPKHFLSGHGLDACERCDAEAQDGAVVALPERRTS